MKFFWMCILEYCTLFRPPHPYFQPISIYPFQIHIPSFISATTDGLIIFFTWRSIIYMASAAENRFTLASFIIVHLQLRYCTYFNFVCWLPLCSTLCLTLGTFLNDVCIPLFSRQKKGSLVTCELVQPTNYLVVGFFIIDFFFFSWQFQSPTILSGNFTCLCTYICSLVLRKYWKATWALLKQAAQNGAERLSV